MTYVEEEVTFSNAEITLAGTLTLPDAPTRHPAVVLLQGSGPLNRDEEVFGMKPFVIIADFFARNGIAVLRYDSGAWEVRQVRPFSTRFQMLPEMLWPPFVT